ncbi:MAG: METTL5 family protein [Promethearchaeota archaeon]
MFIKKKEIISLIQGTKTFKNPKIALEQYTIDAESAINIVYHAGVEYDDIQNIVVFDLGAGTGRLSIASAFLGAAKVISIDIDFEALEILLENVINLNLDHVINIVCCDVSTLEIRKNKFSDVVYSIHLLNEKVDRFIKHFASRFNWKVDYSFPFNMKLERTYSFHEKKVKNIDVRIYRFMKN